MFLVLWIASGWIPLAICIYNAGFMDVYDLIVKIPLCAIAGPIFLIVIVAKVFAEWAWDTHLLDKKIWRKKR